MDTRGPESSFLAHFTVDKYRGKMEDDRYSGYAKVMFTGENEYCGSFAKGRMEGLGTLVWSDGLKYVGMWRDNTAVGKGMLSWPNGMDYFGEVDQGRRHGSGVLYHHSNTYCGEWLNGRRHGVGIQSNSDGEYKGEWINGKRHGWGKLQFASANSFEGSWREDRIEGFGTMLWVSNQQYKSVSVPAAGSLREAVKDARRLTENVGSIAPGPLGPFTPSTWAAKETFERYSGEFRNGKPHGEGQYEFYFFTGSSREIPFETVNQYNGEFVDGLRDGHGVQKYADGTLYDGEWCHNMKHGKGIIIHVNGSRDMVEMEYDAVKSSRPSKPSETNFSIEEAIDIEDLLPSKKDKQEVREIVTRHKNTLRYLFICYSHVYCPTDLVDMIDRIHTSDNKVPNLQFGHRPEVQSLEIPDGVSPQQRNSIVLRSLLHTAQARAVAAAEEGMKAVERANEEFLAQSDSIAVVETDLSDVMVDAAAMDLSMLDDSRPSRSRRSATPMEGMQRSTVELAAPIAPPPERNQRQPHLKCWQLHVLLRDAQLEGQLFTKAAVNDVIAATLRRNCPIPPHSNPLPEQDMNAPEVPFRAFVECLIRIAEHKLSAGEKFMVPNVLAKLTIAQRVEYVLESFMEPLCTTLYELDLSGELQRLGLPSPGDADNNGGDQTLLDLKAAAQSAIEAQQRAATATRGKSKQSDEPVDVSPEYDIPLNVETFEAYVCDRQVLWGSLGVSLEIVSTEVTSSKGVRRLHKLAVIRKDDCAYFGGVCPSFDHQQRVISETVDLRSSIVYPSWLLLCHPKVAHALERNVRQVFDVYNRCAGGEARALLSNILVYFQQRGILLAPETENSPLRWDVFLDVYLRVELAYAVEVHHPCSPGADILRASMATRGNSSALRVLLDALSLSL